SVPLPGLLEQPRVLEGNAEASGDRRDEPNVAVAERMLLVEVLQRDDAGRPIADDQWNEDLRLRRLPNESDRVPDFSGPGFDIFVHDDRLARCHGDLAEPDHLDRFVWETLATLDRVGEVDQARRWVEDPDVDDLRVEDLLDPVSHQVIHHLDVEV